MTTNKINYLPYDTEIIDKPVQRRGRFIRRLPGQNQDGYGSKITTDRMAKVDGRLYRIYATCYSNVPSCWINKGGEKLYVRG